ncbi:MAG: alpha/beta hydrolase [Cytophagales bacterium]|nr:alpha/beta hydrolase [Cytophagales bacterium]
MNQSLFAQQPKKSATLSINGKTIYYEVYGQGEPLILLHGYSLSSASWHDYIADFSDSYELYLIDLTGHGKSAPFSEQLSIRNVAKDLSKLLESLKLDQINAIGFSFGGDVLYQLALLKPDLITSMITIGAVGTWDINDFPQYLEVYTYDQKEKFPWLQNAHASDKHVRGILDQFQYYTVRLSNEEISQIQAEVMIIIGDDDEGMDLKEVARMKEFLPSSDIWILPDVAHGAHEGENKAEFLKKAKKFLSKQ